MHGVRRHTLVVYTAVCLVAAVPAGAGAAKCPPDSAKVGTVCVDLYEASVWQIDPIANPSLVKKVQAEAAHTERRAGPDVVRALDAVSSTPYRSGDELADVHRATVTDGDGIIRGESVVEPASR
jgi:hypothetical protein